ncbi:MAG TPA: pitrilysin family protein [Anaeromyxobacteraceae bacterium]|nr:pitrilysin family protein [Anaeromyxobacteraceae bacterium]
MSAVVLPELRELTLPSGLRIVAARRAGVPLAAARLAVLAGSALDPPGGLGLAHLVALAARRGTGRRSGRAIDDLVESLGADLSGGAEEDATVHGLSAPVEVLPRLLDVLAGVAARPSFPLAELERIRRRERAELAHDADEASTVADRALLDAVYGGHPYGHAVEGRGRDLARLRRADAVRFHARNFSARAALLVVSGPIEPDRVLEAAERRLRSWKGAPEAPAELPPARRGARRVIVVDKPDATQAQVRLGGVAIPRSSPDYFPALVGNTVLGGGFTSRLVEAIRVNRGLTYGVRTRFAVGRVAGLFGLTSFTKVESAGELLAVAFEEMERFSAGGPTGEELSRAAAYLAGLFPLSLETHDQWADRIADAWILGYRLDEVPGFPDRIRAVGAEEARGATARHLPLQDGVVLAVGPATALEPQLRRFGTVEVWPVGRVM